MVTAKRARLMSVAVLLMTFVAGSLAGAATLRVLAMDAAPRRERGPRSPEAMFERLELTAEQRAQAQEIMEDGRAQMETFWTEHGPALRAITDATRARFRAIMTPEQRAIDEAFMARRRQEFQQRSGEGNRNGERRDGQRGPPPVR
ncbi:MAG TPA: hypothetical protein VMN60_04875 [Longimicrobiales bacterium]|nr:hypothetical protein [Longimicrobiales bacterium]